MSSFSDLAMAISPGRVRVFLVLSCFVLSKAVDWVANWAILRAVFVGSILLSLASFALLSLKITRRNERKRTVKVSTKSDDGCAAHLPSRFPLDCAC